MNRMMSLSLNVLITPFVLYQFVLVNKVTSMSYMPRSSWAIFLCFLNGYCTVSLNVIGYEYTMMCRHDTLRIYRSEASGGGKKQRCPLNCISKKPEAYFLFLSCTCYMAGFLSFTKEI